MNSYGAGMTHQPLPRPVLVGIDGSHSGLDAARLGGMLARLYDAPLMLGAVYGFDSVTGRVGSVTWPAHSEAVRWLAAAGQELDDPSLASVRSVTAQSGSRGLLELAEDENAAMIVVGSSHRGAVGRVLAGSTAQRVIHGAPCAVAIAPHGWRVPASPARIRLGVAVCDSPESRQALTGAARLAAILHVPLRVMHAVRLVSPAHPLFAATGTSHAEWVEAELSHGDAIARDAIASVPMASEAEVEVLSGDSAQALIQASQHLDILVLGSRRYGPLRSVALGGVSTQLVEHAACPVLVVPRGATYADDQRERSPARAMIS